MSSDQSPAPDISPCTCAWCTGYATQAAWLEGKTLDEARAALAARKATLDSMDRYNAGGTVATRNYIARLSRAGL